MFSRLLICNIWRVGSSPVQSLNGIRTVPFLVTQQRSFGILSSIRDNVNEKMEEKKQKTAGLVNLHGIDP